MKICRYNENWNRIKSRDELVNHLKRYKGILNNISSDYLQSLLDLEISAVKNVISEEDRFALSELEIYKKIVLYNIYNKALNLLNQEKEKMEINDNNDGIEGLTAYSKLDDRRIKVFDFSYNKENIGNVELFQVIENEEKRKEELERIINALEKLYNEKNPYLTRRAHRVYGGPGSMWTFEHSRKIKEYESKFEQLDNKIELTSFEKKEIELTKRIHDLLIKEFNLDTKEFENESIKPFSITNSESSLNKKLVKRMPNLTIVDNIRYI